MSGSTIMQTYARFSTRGGLAAAARGLPARVKVFIPAYKALYRAIGGSVLQPRYCRKLQAYAGGES